MFLRHITYCQRKSFNEDDYDKIIELSNFKCNLAFHMNKIRDIAIELCSRDPFQDQDFSPMSNYIVQLGNSYHLQNASEWF